MDGVDGTEHYNALSRGSEPSPSLLVVILDTNPLAWSTVSDALPFSSAIANILVFINAHLACNYVNKVAVLASHTSKAQWLYPSPSTPSTNHPSSPSGGTSMRVPNTSTPNAENPSKYATFHAIETAVLRNLSSLFTTTSSPTNPHEPQSTHLSGAFTLALSYINKQTILMTESASSTNAPITSRILHVSLSGPSSLTAQYIPLMNTVFACQRLSIPIDVLAIPLPSPNPSSSTAFTKSPGTTPDGIVAPFLQQASDLTHGIYLPLQHPQGILQTLMFAFLPDPSARQHLIPPTATDVDFRAACFCHRRIVDVGFVCSICLSIFCEPPPNGTCLTCSSQLAMGDYGNKPVVVAWGRKKKKKKRDKDGLGSGATSAAGTPMHA